MALTKKQWIDRRLWLLARHSRITRLKRSRECEGARRGHMSCRNPAYWRFVKLPTAEFSRGGVYCWTHLFSDGLYSDPDEMRVFDRWWDRKTRALG